MISFPYKYLFIFTSIFLILIFKFGNSLHHPPTSGDGPDYDNIAFTLVKHKQFGHDYSSDDFKALYNNHNQLGKYDYLINRDDNATSLTTYRPLLMPLLLAATYYFQKDLRTRTFAHFRIINFILLALAACLIYYFCSKHFNTTTALFSLAFLLLDSSIHYYSSMILTDNLCFFLVTLTLVLLGNISPKTSLHKMCYLGFVVGLVLLCRNSKIWLMPTIFVLLYLKNIPRKHIAIFLLTFLIIVSPWWIRNCFVLKSFMPLGTQGPIGLIDGYSDSNLKRSGQWSDDEASRVIESLRKNNQTLTQVLIAKECFKQTISWIYNNYKKLPSLVINKIKGAVYLHINSFQRLILLLSCLAFIAHFKCLISKQLAFLLIAKIAFIALTYTYNIRMLAPIHGILYIGSGLFISWCCAILRYRTIPEELQGDYSVE